MCHLPNIRSEHKHTSQIWSLLLILHTQSSKISDLFLLTSQDEIKNKNAAKWKLPGYPRCPGSHGILRLERILQGHLPHLIDLAWGWEKLRVCYGHEGKQRTKARTKVSLPPRPMCFPHTTLSESVAKNFTLTHNPGVDVHLTPYILGVQLHNSLLKKYERGNSSISKNNLATSLFS